MEGKVLSYKFNSVFIVRFTFRLISSFDVNLNMSRDAHIKLQIEKCFFLSTKSEQKGYYLSYILDPYFSYPNISLCLLIFETSQSWKYV